MTAIGRKTDSSSNTTPSDLPITELPFSKDCSAFLKWKYNRNEAEHEKSVVFRSLVATLKLQPALDVSLEAKALEFLESVNPHDDETADDFLDNVASPSDNSSPDFVQSIVVLISSPNRAISTATMEMLESLTLGCSARVLYLLIQADLFPQLLTTLNPLSLSFSEGVDIHTNIVKCIINSLWLSTPDGLADIKCEDEDEVQDVHETILTHVLAPSEKYIWLLCLNRFSINDGDQSKFFLGLLAQILRICPYHQPAMDFVLQMPVFLTIPSCLTFFEHDRSIWYFLYEMIDAQLEWNATKGKQQQMWKKVRRMLRMEGIEDVVEEKLQNDQNGLFGRSIVGRSIAWNDQQGMNPP